MGARYLNDILEENIVDRTITLKLTQPDNISKDPAYENLCSILEQDARSVKYPQEIKALKLAIYEAVSNAYKYGDGTKGITINYMANNSKISIIVKDNAQKPCSFDMNKLIIKGMIAKEEGDKAYIQILKEMHQKRTEKYPHKKGAGNGLFLIGYLTDNARAIYEQGEGNIIYLEKHRKA